MNCNVEICGSINTDQYRNKLETKYYHNRLLKRKGTKTSLKREIEKHNRYEFKLVFPSLFCERSTL